MTTTLTADMEQALFARWNDHEDDHALEHLMRAHIPLISRIAREYLGQGVAFLDLFCEGQGALLMAIDNFRPYPGSRLSELA